jgi:hypothetical protein
MIELHETILTFQDACHRLPRRRAGRKTHPHTLYRWSSVGLYGVKLETIQIGGNRCTSLEALQRFFDQLAERKEEMRRVQQS